MPYVTNQGVRIYYEVEGSGPPLALQHGLFGSLEDWRDYGYVSGLNADYTLILIDARGHGKSDKPHQPEQYALKDHVADIAAVLDAQGIERSHYLGFSAGGRYGFGLAQYCPQRLRSLIVLDHHPYPYNDNAKLLNAINALEMWVPQMSDSTSAHKARLLTNDPQALIAEVTPPHHIDPETLRKIAFPCLIVAAGNSEDFENAKRCSEEIPNAAFVVMNGFEHSDMLFRGAEVLPSVIEFLARVG